MALCKSYITQSKLLFYLHSVFSSHELFFPGNNFCKGVGLWSSKYDPSDVALRDDVVVAIILKGKSIGAFVPQAEMLFRDMLSAKESYTFGERATNI